MSNAAQLVIAVSLGVRFSREFLHTAPRWLASVALGTLGMIVLCGGFAWALAWATGLHPATLILGTSPGGIAEMAITAKVLQLGVPVVTAFQVCRLVAVLLIVGPMYRLDLPAAGRAPMKNAPGGALGAAARPRSVNEDGRVRQFGVALERVFDFFLRGRVELPGGDLLLEQFGPGPVEVDLLAGALVHDLEAVAREHGNVGRCRRVAFGRLHVHDDE